MTAIASVTIVTVVFEADVHGLEIQARSIARHADTELIKEVIVIENFERAPSPEWRLQLLRLYGPVAQKVTFRDAQTTAPKAVGLDGWWSQQVAKLEIARVIRSPAYLVLDAKHHLTKRLDRSFLQGSDGRLRIRAANYSGHPLKNFLDNVIAEFALDPTIAQRFPTTTPPFPLWTDEVLQLLAHAETKAGSIAAYMSDRQLTEFFLYAGFLASRGELNDLYELHDLAYPMIWPGQSSDEKCRDLVATARRGESPFFAVHRKAGEELSPNARREVAKLWLDAGLVETEDEGSRLISSLYSRPSILNWIKARLRKEH